MRNNINRIKKMFRDLWKYKIFRYAILINIFYFILSLILTLFFLRNRNDFLVYYEGGKVFINNVNELYNNDYYTSDWPFRYFPISAIFFVPFYLMGFDLGFIIFNFINLILNIIICFVLYKLIILIRSEDHEQKDKRIVLYISMFLMGLPNIFNYILGQINLYITLLILVSLYLFLKFEDTKYNLIASIILGISILFKPITIFLIPFLMVIHFDLEQKKFELKFFKSIIRLIGFLIPVSLNFLVFLMYPELLKGFLDVNLTGEDTVIVNHSFSITKLIQNFFIVIGFSQEQLLSFQLPIFLIIIIILGGIGFSFYIMRKFENYSLIYGYTFGILIMLLGYFDSWDHHLLILTPLLIIIIFNLPRRSDLTRKFNKPSFFFLNFFDLAFFGVWVLIQDWFPFNFASTIFLLLLFYSNCKCCLIKVMPINNNKF
ncbi:MAG: glycosyltransferase 87 family protein [Promethearchaeota archaeon]